MEETIYKIVVESLPFMSKALLWGIFIGFLVFLFMKLYARFEKIETSTGQLIVWSHTVENRFADFDKRFVEIDKRFVAIETRLYNLEIRVEKIERRLDQMEEKFDHKFDVIIQLITKNQEITNQALFNLAQSKA